MPSSGALRRRSHDSITRRVSSSTNARAGVFSPSGRNAGVRTAWDDADDLHMPGCRVRLAPARAAHDDRVRVAGSAPKCVRGIVRRIVSRCAERGLALASAGSRPCQQRTPRLRLLLLWTTSDQLLALRPELRDLGRDLLPIYCSRLQLRNRITSVWRQLSEVEDKLQATTKIWRRPDRYSR